MVPKYLVASVSIRSVKVTFGPFQSLCSSDDACRPISSPYISTCIACSALLFGTKIYLSKTYKPYKTCTCLMGINGVITVLPNSRLNFHRVQCKIDDLFSLGCLAPIPLTTLYLCSIDNLRMRMYLQHLRCFPSPAIGVKRFIL